MIKKAFQIILSLTIIFSISITAFCEEKVDQTAYPKSILIMGDSISTGYGLENYSADKTKALSYGNLLAKKYSITNSYINRAIDGSTSEEFLMHLKKKEYDKYIKNSEVIIVSIGGNDVLEKLLDTIITTIGLPPDIDYADLKNVDFNNPEIYKRLFSFFTSNQLNDLNNSIVNSFKTNFLQITNYIYNQNPNAKVIYQNVYNPFSGAENLEVVETITEMIVKNINQIITSNSKIQKDGNSIKLYKLVDVYISFKSNSNQYTNISTYDIHPNVNGHKKIFELCDNAILKYDEIITIPNQTEISKTAAATQVTVMTTVSDIPKPVEEKVTQNSKIIIFVIFGTGGLIGLGLLVYRTKKIKK